MAQASRRAALTAGFGIGGLFTLFGRAQAQSAKNDAPAKDKDQDQGAKRGLATALGTVDITAAYKISRKVKGLGEVFKAEVAARKVELDAVRDTIQRENDRLSTLAPDSAAHQNTQATIKALEAQYETKRKDSEAEFGRREAKMLCQLSRETEQIIAALAKKRGLLLVVRKYGPMEDVTDPAKAIEALGREILYADASLDLTQDVVAQLDLGA